MHELWLTRTCLVFGAFATILLLFACRPSADGDLLATATVIFEELESDLDRIVAEFEPCSTGALGSFAVEAVEALEAISAITNPEELAAEIATALETLCADGDIEGYCRASTEAWARYSELEFNAVEITASVDACLAGF